MTWQMTCIITIELKSFYELFYESVRRVSCHDAIMISHLLWPGVQLLVPLPVLSFPYLS